MSWGGVALEENSGHIDFDKYEVTERYSTYKWDSWLGKKFTKEKIISNVSNNHIIVLDKNVKKILNKVKQGQVVRIMGYLATVDTSLGVTWGPSSMTRTDEGSRASEIILADKIIIMP